MNRESSEKSRGPRGWNSPPETWAKLRDGARSFRHNATTAEEQLWQALRNRRVAGARFRRQHAIERYVVDFYCREAMLVVEVDGGIHRRQAEHDAVRQVYLEKLGLLVLRFPNDEVMSELDDVVARIQNAVLERSLPSPKSEM